MGGGGSPGNRYKGRGDVGVTGRPCPNKSLELRSQSQSPMRLDLSEDGAFDSFPCWNRDNLDLKSVVFSRMEISPVFTVPSKFIWFFFCSSALSDNRWAKLAAANRRWFQRTRAKALAKQLGQLRSASSLIFQGFPLMNCSSCFCQTPKRTPNSPSMGLASSRAFHQSGYKCFRDAFLAFSMVSRGFP